MISLKQIRQLTDRKALKKYLADRCQGSIEQLLKDLDAGLNELLRTDLKKAQKFVELSSKCSDHLPPEQKPRFVSQQARCALWSGDYKLAYKKYDSALGMFLKNRNYEAAARLRKGLVDVLMYLGRYQEAVEAGQKAIRYFRKKGLTIDTAQTMTNVGNVYHRMDRNTKALACYDSARSIFEKSGGVALAIVDFNRANIYTNLNQLSQARTLYHQSAEFYGKAGMDLARSQAEYSIAYLLFLEDSYTEALTAFENVRESFSSLGDAKTAAITSLDLVELYVRINQYGSAIMQGEEVIPRFKKLGMKYEEAKTHYFVALAKLELSDLPAANSALNRARKIFTAENNSLWLGMVHLARARILMARKKFGQAIESTSEAEPYFKKSRDYRRQTDVMLVRLEACFASGLTQKANRLAGSVAGRKLAGYQQYQRHCIIGDFHFDQKDYTRALASHQQAVVVVERMLSGLYEDEIRFFFATDKYHSYARVVECMLHMKEIDRAFLSNLSALAMINRSIVSHKSLSNRIGPQLTAEIDALRASLNKLQRLPREGERGTAAGSDYLVTEEKLWRCQRKARTGAYSRAQLITPSSLKVDQIRDALDQNETLIDFFISGQLVGAFVATNGRTEFVRFDISAEDLQVLVRKLTFVMERSVSASGAGTDDAKVSRHYLSLLHIAVFAPLEEHISGDNVTIIADGIFRQIPFAALCDRGGTYLKDRFLLKIVLNPEDLLRSNHTPVRFASSRNAIFGVRSSSLPMVEVESRQIKKEFGRSRLYLGERADCRHLNLELEQAGGFVHIATHASRSSENPLFSRILMSDGPYFPFDLFGTGINSTLVTLSGCQTAAPGLYYGNSFSLAGAFCRAGSRSVLASLWPVLDEASLYYMSTFYAWLKKTNDISDSHLHAMSTLQDSTGNPALWGSFVLIGT